jgi:nitroreductase
MSGNHEAQAALVRAAGTAGHAPSIHNTQPWRWHAHADALDLYADRTRQLSVSDPVGRLLAVSCGAALHHAVVSLAAQGWATKVDLLPDGDVDHLARIAVAGRVPVSADAVRLAQTIELRHTDRRPVADTPVAAEALEAIGAAATGQGVHVHILRPGQVLELAAVAGHAQAAEGFDESWREEMAYWAGAGTPPGAGVPPEVVPRDAPQTTVPARDFGKPGTLPVDTGHDRAAVYAILYGAEDELADWLRAGEALSSAWLTAVEHGVSVVPLSAVIEVDATRHELRRLLAGVGYPYLAMRLGVPDPDRAGPPHTPRLPAGQTITVDTP